jgi:hypothetical protein
LVDLHNHISGGMGDLNDMVYLVNPELKASSTVTPRNSLLQRAVAGGVTSVLYIPGSGTNMGGQGILLKTGLATYEEMRIRDPGSLKLAQAGNPERWAIGVGRSFMNWNTRDTFERGLAYAALKKSGKVQENIQWDVFPALADKTTQVSTHTQRYQVVLATLTMVRQGFGLDVYIDHGEWHDREAEHERPVAAGAAGDHLEHGLRRRERDDDRLQERGDCHGEQQRRVSVEAELHRRETVATAGDRKQELREGRHAEGHRAGVLEAGARERHVQRRGARERRVAGVEEGEQAVVGAAAAAAAAAAGRGLGRAARRGR